MAKQKPVKLSWCEVHEKIHALSSGLCTHPDCVKKIIWTHAKTWKVIKKSWSYINKLKCADDFAIYCVAELLREEQEQGKKPTLNPWWLKFRLRKYVASHIHKSNLPVQSVPRIHRRKIDQTSIYIDAVKDKNKHIIEEMIREGSFNASSFQTAEGKYLHNELRHSIQTKFGETVLLYLTDEITRNEYIKLMAVGIAAAFEYLKIVKEHSKQFFINGEWEPVVDEQIEDWKKKHDVKHKI